MMVSKGGDYGLCLVLLFPMIVFMRLKSVTRRRDMDEASKQEGLTEFRKLIV